MRMRRGKAYTEPGSLRPHQFCNDWISADTVDGKAKICNPTSVVLESDEEHRFFLNDTNPGTFWAEFELHDDGTFTRRSR